MSEPAVQQRRTYWPDVAELFAGLPTWAHLRSPLGDHTIKVEDEVEDGAYHLKAEIPGVDPDKDVTITVRDGVLTIKAERSEKKESNGRSEFSYGTFVRSMTLPAGADDDSIKATYDRGVLDVTVPLSESQTPEKRISIEKSK